MSALPWTLLEPLAAGGMAEVWRGRHERSGRRVALKVLTTEDARSPAAIEGFRAEVRAAARLDHPQIAWVLDYGALPESWEQQTEGRLVAGSPFMVTEEARGGDLRRWVRRPPDWPTLSTALHQLLDALAFAHARGVIHRDLKPANVLLGTLREERHGVLLADFGIAHRMSDLPEPGYRPTAGTRTYMAPEQIAGDWRSYGPWTDLYALGVMTWAMTQGELPASAEGAVAALEWGVPRLNTPAGLPRWLARLLREDPAERFPNAASAAAALRELRIGPGRARAPLSRLTAPPDALTEADTAAAQTQHGDSTLGHLLFTGRTLSAPPPVRALRLTEEPIDLPTLSPPERRPPEARPPPPLDLVDAGLGLFGLRDRPVVGREAERDALWSALVEAHAAGAPRLVLLTGPLGVGKSRLIRWFTERIDELGVARTATARLGRDAEGGLLSMVARTLRVRGVPPGELETALEAAWPGRFDADERRALVDLLSAPRADGRSSAMTTGERYALVLHALRRAAGPQTLLITLDEAASDADGVGFARHVLGLSQERAGPVLLVLATRDDALAASAEASSRWAELSRQPQARSLALGPLPREDWPRLATASLALSAPLRDRVAARAAGNPLFAELIVDAWVSQGALVVGRAGFELAPGAELGLPESVSALVADQRRALEDLGGPEDRIALEIAATLGLEVDTLEWTLANERAGVSPSPDLLDVAMGRRLVRPTAGERGFAFCHNMLRLALLEGASAGGRAEGHHRAAAEALESLERGGPERLGRLGRHYLSGGRLERAAGPLLEAATTASLTGGYAELHELLDLLELTLPALAAPERDRVAARLWCLRGHLQHFGLGDRAEARRCYQRALESAERSGDPALVLDARRRLGGVTFGLGEQRAAERILEETLAAAEALGDLKGRVEIGCDLATVLQHGGRNAEAQRIGARTLEVLRVLNLPELWARSLSTNWYLDALPDQAARDEALATSARELRRLRLYQHLGTTLNQLGAAARARGDTAECGRYYREATEVLEEIGSSYASMPRFNYSVWLWREGDLAGAYAACRRALRDLLSHRWVWLEPHVRSFLARLELETGDIPAAEAQLAPIRALWAAGGAAEHNVSETLDNTARRALELGHPGTAAAMAQLAEELYRAGGEPERAEALRDISSLNHSSSK